MSTFAVKEPVSFAERLTQMRWNITHQKVGRLRDVIIPVHAVQRAAVACYGPSLVDTWQALSLFTTISVSGAHDFLRDRGITPDYHVECDPRPHKADFLRRPSKQTIYCIASCCHPKVFSALKGCEVLMWHNGTPPIDRMRDMLQLHDPGSKLVGGGSTVGLRALSVGIVLGWRAFDIHGMDCSYRDDQVWAGPHGGESHRERFQNRIGNRVFDTSTTMYNAMLDFYATLRMAQGIDFTLHGDGMLKHAVELGLETEEELLCPADGSAVVRIEVPDEVVP